MSLPITLRRISITLVAAAAFATTAVAQKKVATFDSSYYKTYPREITGRVFLSQKYTRLKLDAPGNSSLKYVPNNPFAVGVGASYGIATLNVGIGIPGSKDEEEKGKTKSLDLQPHIYARKWVVDLYGQFYKGYYLSDKGRGTTEGNYYKRPDMKVRVFGASAYHIFNSERFSYRASFLQLEWQKKSAGSFLLGGEAYYGSVKGDSALAPTAYANAFGLAGIYKTNFIEFGPGAGYAYTLVLDQHWFVTASGTVNADLSFTNEYGNAGKEKKTTISPNFTLRGVAGYNSDNWIATASWVENNLNATGSADREYLARTGNFRITIAKRLNTSRKLRKKLDMIEQPAEQPK